MYNIDIHVMLSLLVSILNPASLYQPMSGGWNMLEPGLPGLVESISAAVTLHDNQTQRAGKWTIGIGDFPS